MKASISKVNCANRCLRKYKYSYVDKIQKIRKDTKPQLGSIGHESLEYYFKGRDWTVPIAAYEVKLRAMMEEEQALYAHIPSELYRMVRGYLNYWKKRDTGVEILAVEKEFVVKTPGGNEQEGIIDLIYKDADGVWIEDHKFVKQIPSEAVRYLDAQTNTYYVAAKKLGYDPTGIVFDYVRTKPPTSPRILKNGTVSKADCDTDLETYLAQVKAAGQNPADYREILEKLQYNVFYKRSRVPRPAKLAANVLKDFDNTCSLLDLLASISSKSLVTIYPRTVNMNCSWDCPFCELCFAELAGQNVDYILATNYEPRMKKKEEKEYGDSEG